MNATMRRKVNSTCTNVQDHPLHIDMKFHSANVKKRLGWRWKLGKTFIIGSIALAITSLALFHINISLLTRGAISEKRDSTHKLYVEVQVQERAHQGAAEVAVPFSPSSSSTSSPRTSSFLHPLHLVPEEPDLSIGNYLRSIIPVSTFVPNETEHRNKNANDENASNNISESPLSFCSPTSQIRISSTYMNMNMNMNMRFHSDLYRNDTNTTNSNVWIIEALDEQGRRKFQGGDEFYITYTDRNKNQANRPTAVAFITDQQDGTYSLDFVSLGFGANVPLSGIAGAGSLDISILYTCGIGRMTRPSKDDWTTGGHLHHDRYTYRVANVTAPPIRQVRRPNTMLDEDGIGISRKIDLSKYDQVFCFGDSLLENFCGNSHGKPLFRQKNMQVSDNVGRLVRSDTLEEAFGALEDAFGEELDHTTSTSSTTTTNTNTSGDTNATYATALILDSANWELCSNLGPLPGRYFHNSLQMYRDYIMGVRARYPHTAIYWKSPQAIHPVQLKEEGGCYKNEWCVARMRYASPSNMEYLYHQQKRIMRELDVPFLDLWEITHVSDTWHTAGDQSHYRHWFNMYLLDSYYPVSMKLLKK